MLKITKQLIKKVIKNSVSLKNNSRKRQQIPSDQKAIKKKLKIKIQKLVVNQKINKAYSWQWIKTNKKDKQLQLKWYQKISRAISFVEKFSRRKK